jgi:hypothetical protein
MNGKAVGIFLQHPPILALIRLLYDEKTVLNYHMKDKLHEL